jgi:hypothetical protein
MSNVSVSVHGASFQIEDASRVDRVTRRGWGIEVAAYRHGGAPGPAAWLHAPIPIAAAWELEPLFSPHGGSILWVEMEEQVRLTEVGITFDASADEFLHVRTLDVWNGGTRIAHFDDLNERGPELTRSFTPPLQTQGWQGLNLSIGLEFPINIDSPSPPPAPAIVFNSAYAFFTVTA